MISKERVIDIAGSWWTFAIVVYVFLTFYINLFPEWTPLWLSHGLGAFM